MTRILHPLAGAAALAAPMLAAPVPAAAATDGPGVSARPASTAPPRLAQRRETPRRTAPRRWTPRRDIPRRTLPGPELPRRYAVTCIPGFQARSRGGTGSYDCVALIRFVCAHPYAYQRHGLLPMGGDGDYWPYYRCRRTYRARQLGAPLCAAGFQKVGAPPNPATVAAYNCRGQEPACSPGYHYVGFTKMRGGWRYRCVR